MHISARDEIQNKKTKVQHTYTYEYISQVYNVMQVRNNSLANICICIMPCVITYVRIYMYI